MTRTPRDAVGKPLPRGLVEDGVPEFIEEPTVPDAVMPSVEELEAELFQHGGGEFQLRKGPR